MQEIQKAGASIVRAVVLVEIGMGVLADRSVPGRPYRDLRISLGTEQGGAFNAALSFATGTPDLAYAVARNELQLAAINPSAFLTMAYRGTGPFSDPLPLRAVATMPSWDRMAFGVFPKTGLTSLEDIARRRYPLRVSIRRNPAHATRFVIDQALAAAGLSLRDIEAWGGSVQYVDAPSDDERMAGLHNDSLDAVFDEGIKSWGRIGLDLGMTFLPLGAAVEERFRGLGWPIGPIPRASFPKLERDLPGLSFSGWPIFTHADLPEDDVYRMCRALDAAKSSIAWDSPTEVRLADLCGDTDAAPRGAPLHPGAERYYREHGGLD